MQISPASDSSILVTLGDSISAATTTRVHAVFHALHQAPPSWLTNLHPAYTTLLVDYDPSLMDASGVIDFLRQLPTDLPLKPSRRIELPVRYDGQDLEEVAHFHSITVENLKRIHSEALYHVAFLGFSPGFAYLQGLPAEIATPRLSSPRRLVPAGSVGIGGNQTGVYPQHSPGGWRIIGHLALPDPCLPPDWAAPGDWVRFVPV
jgi:inhibitor of KinA